MTILCMLPLQKEWHATRTTIESFDLNLTSRPLGRLDGWYARSIDCLFVVGGHGKVQMGVQTQYVMGQLSSESISTIICMGAAGGLTSAVSVFDVVLSTGTVEHDYTLKFTPKPPPTFTTSMSTVDAILSAVAKARVEDAKQWPFEVIPGIVASGDEDVVSAERAASLHRQTDAFAVAWEGAGAARVAAFHDLPFLELRAITDVANHDARADFKANLPIAMANLTQALVTWRLESSQCSG